MMNSPLTKKVDGKSDKRGYNQMYRPKKDQKAINNLRDTMKSGSDRKKAALKSVLGSLGSGASFRNQ